MKTYINDLFIDPTQSIKEKIENLPMENVIENFFNYVYSEKSATTEFEIKFIKKLKDDLIPFCYNMHKKHKIYIDIKNIDDDFNYREIENIDYFNNCSKEQLLEVIKEYESNLYNICINDNYIIFENYGYDEFVDYFGYVSNSKEGIKYKKGMYEDIKKYMRNCFESLIDSDEKKIEKAENEYNLANYNFAVKKINEFIQEIDSLKENLIKNGSIKESEINEALSSIKEKL